MKERMKYVEEFLAESEKNENLDLMQIGLYGLSKPMWIKLRP